MSTRTVFLSGKEVFLSPLSTDDNLDDYSRWLNDQEVTIYMDSGRLPVTIDGVKEYINRYAHNNNGMLLGIFLKKTSKHIGNITLHQIDWKNRHGEIGLMIGDKKSWGKGYATDVIRLLTEHAFYKLNLRKLYAGTISGNEGSKKAFENIGFKEEGIMKEHFYLNGKYLDCYLMGLLKSEYRKE